MNITLHRTFGRAMERCMQIAESEYLLGFKDSAELYREMAYEFEYLSLWVTRETND